MTQKPEHIAMIEEKLRDLETRLECVEEEERMLKEKIHHYRDLLISVKFKD
jgi:chaperonin cofactor prefoldin